MYAIYKYKLEVVEHQIIRIPGLVRILSIQKQDGDITMWAVVNPEAPIEKMPVRIIATGQPFSDFLDWQYVQTVQSGGFVWHFFVKDLSGGHHDRS